MTFDLRLWSSLSVKVTFTLIIMYISTKYEVCMLNRIWDIDNCLEKTKMMSQWRHHQFDFLWNSITNLPRVYLSDILNFISIWHERAKIQNREVNKEKKKWKLENWKLHYVNPKGKFILSLKDQRQGPWFKVSFEGPSSEIHILIRSPVQVLTEAAVA